jgi:L-fuculose-phosphate aldolase
MKSPAELVAYTAGMMFERRLTDISGGNVSMRVDDTVYLTPRYAGKNMHWNLTADDIVSGPVMTDELYRHPRFSREGLSHLAVYRAYPEAKAVIHAHPFYVLPFCSLLRPIEPVLRATEKYGTLDFIPDTAPYSQEQADHIVEYFRGQEERMAKIAAAVLLPRHGILVASGDMYEALDALDRINTNAYCILARQQLGA